MRTLVIDIETSPFVSYSFKQWQTNIYPAQVIKVPEVMCFAWKWHGDSGGINFIAGDNHPNAGWTDSLMAAQAHDLLSQADAAVTFNGDKFDLGHLHRLVDRLEQGPPSPYKSVDLRKTAKRHFMFPYNSLDYICGELNIGTKLKHAGLQMWIDCIAGDPKAWTQMMRYNKHDVRLTDGLFERWIPWINGHPNFQIVDSLNSRDCPRCGMVDGLVRQGKRFNVTGAYPRFRCTGCKGWSQGSRRIDSVSVRDAS
jgi:hypothetical protein